MEVDFIYLDYVGRGEMGGSGKRRDGWFVLSGCECDSLASWERGKKKQNQAYYIEFLFE